MNKKIKKCVKKYFGNEGVKFTKKMSKKINPEELIAGSTKSFINGFVSSREKHLELMTVQGCEKFKQSMIEYVKTIAANTYSSVILAGLIEKGSARHINLKTKADAIDKIICSEITNGVHDYLLDVDMDNVMIIIAHTFGARILLATELTVAEKQVFLQSCQEYGIQFPPM